MQWTVDNLDAVDLFVGPDGVMGGLSDAYYIETPEGRMKANPGDWIIKGIKGEFYPCKPDIFEATYEAVAPEPAVL